MKKSKAPDGLSQADTISLSALETTLQSNEAEEVNFDDMWDTMSADVSTAMEYERKQRENFRKKKEKKSSRRHDDEQESDDVKRLRLFEKYSDKDDKKKGKRGRGKKKKEKLSMEFLTAIREVFDEDEEADSEGDESEASFGSRDDDSRANRARDEDDDETEGHDVNDERSEMSMFIGTQHFVNNKRKGEMEDLGSVGSDADPSFAGSDDDNSYADKRSGDEDDVSDARSRRSHRSKSSRKSGRSNRSSRTSRSTSSRSTRVKRQPAEVLQEELKRQQGDKLLSVSNLKQEMSDRRGTSVELLKREFEKQKREKDSIGIVSNQGIGTSNFGAFSGGFGSASSGAADSKDLFGSSGFDSNFSDTGKTNEEAEAIVSRWATTESVTDLDDLLTVQQDTNLDSSGPGTFGFGPPTTIIQNVPSLPNMSSIPSLPVDLLGGDTDKTKGRKSGKKKKKQNPFEANFDDMPMPMTTITEFDEEDDNEMGLLASSSMQDDDEMSYRSTRSSRNRGGRFKMSLKAPKLGIGKIMPRKKAGSKRSSSGFFSDDDDMGSGGLLG